MFKCKSIYSLNACHKGMVKLNDCFVLTVSLKRCQPHNFIDRIYFIGPKLYSALSDLLTMYYKRPKCVLFGQFFSVIFFNEEVVKAGVSISQKNYLQPSRC